MNFEERTLNVVNVLTENIVVNITANDTDVFDVYVCALDRDNRQWGLTYSKILSTNDQRKRIPHIFLKPFINTSEI